MPRRARLRTMRGMLSVWTMSSSSPRDRARLKKNFLVGWYVTVPLSWKPTTIFSHLSLQHTHTHTEARARIQMKSFQCHFSLRFHLQKNHQRKSRGAGEIIRNTRKPQGQLLAKPLRPVMEMRGLVNRDRKQASL